MNPCMGHGLCLEDGSCNCSTGFYGKTCGASCGTGLAGLTCSGRGTCTENGVCACQSGMAGLISGYEGDVCQKIVYNRTGLRAFNTAVIPDKSGTVDRWMALVAPIAIAGVYALVSMKRAISSFSDRS
jgi:hypothetical protein